MLHSVDWKVVFVDVESIVLLESAVSTHWKAGRHAFFVFVVGQENKLDRVGVHGVGTWFFH